MSRTRTVERRKQREQQKKRQRQMGVLVGVVAVVVVAIVLIIVVSLPQDAPIPPESQTRYEGLPQSVNDQGFPVIGSQDAPVKVLEYSSFDCPHCYDFHNSVTPSIIDQVRAGVVQFTYVPMYGTGGIENGRGAGAAAVCAAEQNAFWKFHDALFNWQGLYGNQAFSNNRISTGVNNLGINRGQWDQCISSGRGDQVMDAGMRQAGLQNISATPSVVINGTLLSSIDASTVLNAIKTAFDQSGQPAAVIGGAAVTPEATAGQ
jgi:protein-disulfide isomerase